METPRTPAMRAPARERQADRRQGRAQPFGPLTVPARQARYLLDEGTACAVRVSTVEPSDFQLKDNPSASAGNISRKPQVGTVNPVRPGATDRARGTVGGASCVNSHYRDVHVYRQHRDGCDQREQQLLEPEQTPFHGPEHSARLHAPGIIFRRLHSQLEEAQQSRRVAASQKLSQSLHVNEATGSVSRLPEFFSVGNCLQRHRDAPGAPAPPYRVRVRLPYRIQARSKGAGGTPCQIRREACSG